MVDIDEVLRNESLAVWFQPIVSVRRQTIQVLEALSRGIDPSSGEIIYPKDLFGAAEEAGRQLELDMLCLRKSLENFADLQHKIPDAMLSLNLTYRLINSHEDVNWLCRMLNDFTIQPNRVIIEILEQAISDKAHYCSFLNHCRQNHVLLALDDIGSGYSSLIRLSEIQPDLIKIDRNLVKDLDKEHCRREVVRSLTELAHRIGVLVVAEGIERPEEAMECMVLGVDMQQGFLYSRAHSFENGTDPNCRDMMRQMASLFRQHSQLVHRKRREQSRHKSAEIKSIVDEITKVMHTDLDAALYWLAQKYTNLQFIYVLDENGITISDTVGRVSDFVQQRRFLFRPARKGENLSLKDYFLWIKTGLKRFVSEPYISSATGMECITHSCRCTTADGIDCIVCVDMHVADEEQAIRELIGRLPSARDCSSGNFN